MLRALKYHSYFTDRLGVRCGLPPSPPSTPEGFAVPDAGGKELGGAGSTQGNREQRFHESSLDSLLYSSVQTQLLIGGHTGRTTQAAAPTCSQWRPALSQLPGAANVNCPSRSTSMRLNMSKDLY